MSARIRTFLLLGIFVLALTGLAAAFGGWTSRALAASTPPTGPDRYKAVVVEYTSYEWWLVRWKDNAFNCDILIDHPGLPTGPDVYKNCGSEGYENWADSTSCPGAGAEEGRAVCEGYYLQFVKSNPARREISVKLPPPLVWVSLIDCASQKLTNRCYVQPTLLLTGVEPLPNETILRIVGTIDGQSFLCPGVTCELPLQATSEDGILVEFWAYSSYGDSSERFTAQVRVTESGEDDPQGLYWVVDVISVEWTGTPIENCAASWEAFPPVGGPPPWLTSPDDPVDLSTSIPYTYLAGNLITQGLVDVSACPDGGLLPGGGASPCGLDAAEPEVTDWQNRFDTLIFNVAKDFGIPAQLIKNLFSRESQFWPGVFTDTPEVGLGQMTEDGADTTLLWNPSFYEQFCPLVLEDAKCRKGYLRLGEEDQIVLRRALVHNVDAHCADCPSGLDLSQADFSVEIFAQTLLANCAQAGRIVRNVTQSTPGKAVGYVDLWRFTLVNYNAGAGCLSIAMQDTWDARLPLDWENVSKHLPKACRGAINYVEDISR